MLTCFTATKVLAGTKVQILTPEEQPSHPPSKAVSALEAELHLVNARLAQVYTSTKHTSAYVSIRQHTSAYVSIRMCMCAYILVLLYMSPRTTIYVSSYSDSTRAFVLRGGGRVFFFLTACLAQLRKASCLEGFFFLTAFRS